MVIEALWILSPEVVVARAGIDGHGDLVIIWRALLGKVREAKTRSVTNEACDHVGAGLAPCFTEGGIAREDTGLGERVIGLGAFFEHTERVGKTVMGIMDICIRVVNLFLCRKFSAGQGGLSWTRELVDFAEGGVGKGFSVAGGDALTARIFCAFECFSTRCASTPHSIWEAE